jgi:hypothetical protein
LATRILFQKHSRPNGKTSSSMIPHKNILKCSQKR